MSTTPARRRGARARPSGLAALSFVALAAFAGAVGLAASRDPTSKATAGAGAPASRTKTTTASGAPAGTASSPVPVNLLLITLDTTRADHLGCYGDAQAATPHLDRLAADGARADTAIAVTPLTLPSHCSLLTGVSPPRHGVHDNADYRLPPGQPTLATHLRGRGYATAAVVGSIVLSGSLGLAKGFDAYDEPSRRAAAVKTPPRGGEATGVAGLTPGPRKAFETRTDVPGGQGAAVSYEEILDRRAGAVTDAALRILGGISKTRRPFFVWVHYYDPHAEYDPPSPWRERFAQRPYDGEIAYTDAQLGRLIDSLRKAGRLDRTLVVVVADHGESLGEHGESTHGLFVYDATLRVPLILRLPGVIPPGTRVRDVVSGVDLVPTILDLMGQPAMRAVEGVSFAESARGRTAAARPPAYSESRLAERSYGWAPLFTLRDASFRYVESPEPELYDERRDPAESRNIASISPGPALEFRERLRAAMRESARGGANAQEPMTQEERERLASLGYLSGASPSGSPAGSGPQSSTKAAGDPQGAARAADPKSRLAIHVALLDIKKLISAGQREEARRRLGPVLAEDPGNAAALAMQGVLDFSAGQRDEGLERLRDAARRSPGVYENQANLANALHAAGRLPEAASAWRAALALRPAEATGHYALGNVLAAQQNAAGAIREYEEAIRLGSDAPGLHAALGVARLDSGDTAGARRALQQAVAADPSLTGAWTALGRAEARAARSKESLAAYDRCLALSPTDPDALFGRALARLQLGRRALAEDDARRLGEAHPLYPALGFLRGKLLLASGDAAGARHELTAYLAQPRGVDPQLADSAREMLRDLDRHDSPATSSPR
jgi:choline-sulfatase